MLTLYLEIFMFILDPDRITCNLGPEKVCPVCPGTFYKSKFLVITT